MRLAFRGEPPFGSEPQGRRQGRTFLQPFLVENARQADNRVELIDSSVSLDAGRVFGNPPAAYQRRLPLVSRAGIYPCDPDGHISKCKLQSADCKMTSLFPF